MWQALKGAKNRVGGEGIAMSGLHHTALSLRGAP